MPIKRLVSALSLIFLSVFAIVFRPMCAFCVTFLIALGLYEFFNMVEKKGIPIYKYVGIAIGVTIPLSIFFKFEPTKSWELLFMVLVLLSITILQFRRPYNKDAIVGMSTTIFGILYIAWFFSFVLKLRISFPQGVKLLAMLVWITKTTDIGAYLIGSRFGKTPLIPRISPGKTVEGAIGGIIFSVLASVATKPWVPFSYLQLVIFGVVLSVLAQFGDLSESLIKRDCQVKDSGNLFPGMGGVLDAIDSLLFTAPIFYFYISSILK
ncbi:MAG: phosphatidate cytidylyltransferase [Candidatus Omnitrophota bacterium]